MSFMVSERTAQHRTDPQRVIKAQSRSQKARSEVIPIVTDREFLEITAVKWDVLWVKWRVCDAFEGLFAEC
jgi:hypothetical protein